MSNRTYFFVLLILGGLFTQAQIPAGKDKIIVYQLLPRLFSNTNSTNKFYGSKEENGVGKFNDINEKALQEIKKLGVTHLWYTGVIEHATMSDYSWFGIKTDDPDIVKGRAGSPYAIKDYYDVDPDLAVNVNRRMKEFEALVERTHKAGMKVILDFVPNHVARTYHSDARPKGVIDFGEKDDTSSAYLPTNDFYYITGKPFEVPDRIWTNASGFRPTNSDGHFNESPAKATGNNVFNAKPSKDDWYETIKLNYGLDIIGNKKYIDPIPGVWHKMKDILAYWARKKVDGFRCDVAEFVPVEFWSWVIPELKKIDPQLIFIAESYDPSSYNKYVFEGKFDYLYDKVGLYDVLKKLIKNETGADVNEIDKVINAQGPSLWPHMLRFLENHDEERIASDGFAGDPQLAVPAMVVTATLSTGPVMLYFGQELGVKANDAEGFGGADGRTTIFDYWGVPELQQWVNEGKFDGGKLSAAQQALRTFYQQLMEKVKSSAAIHSGNYLRVNDPTLFNKRQFAYIRYHGDERILVVANFDREKTIEGTMTLSADMMQQMGVKDKKEVQLKVPPSKAVILTL